MNSASVVAFWSALISAGCSSSPRYTEPPEPVTPRHAEQLSVTPDGAGRWDVHNYRSSTARIWSDPLNGCAGHYDITDPWYEWRAYVEGRASSHHAPCGMIGQTTFPPGGRGTLNSDVLFLTADVFRFVVVDSVSAKITVVKFRVDYPRVVEMGATPLLEMLARLRLQGCLEPALQLEAALAITGSPRVFKTLSADSGVRAALATLRPSSWPELLQRSDADTLLDLMIRSPRSLASSSAAADDPLRQYFRESLTWAQWPVDSWRRVAPLLTATELAVLVESAPDLSDGGYGIADVLLQYTAFERDVRAPVAQDLLANVAADARLSPEVRGRALGVRSFLMAGGHGDPRSFIERQRPLMEYRWALQDLLQGRDTVDCPDEAEVIRELIIPTMTLEDTSDHDLRAYCAGTSSAPVQRSVDLACRELLEED